MSTNDQRISRSEMVTLRMLMAKGLSSREISEEMQKPIEQIIVHVNRFRNGRIYDRRSA